MTWYRGDPTGPQLRALKALAGSTNSGGYVGSFVNVAPLGTFRALHRLGMVTSNTPDVTRNSYVQLTEHGRNCAQDAR